MEKEILLLNKIGLTDTEAKVYLTLLQNGSLTGYETSKLAGVPRSKIYVLLETLVRKGFILFTQYETNNKYSAFPITEISDRVKEETTATLSQLAESLSVFPQRTNLDDLWHIRTNGNVFSKCRDIIRKTEKELLLQIWAEDLPHVLKSLQVLEEQNLRLGIVIFNSDPKEHVPLRKFYRHGMADEKKKEMGGRWVTLVSDMKEVVFGQIINDTVAEVIWTESRPMISLAAECVRHDLYFYKCVSEIPDIMKEHFGDGLEDIRNIY